MRVNQLAKYGFPQNVISLWEEFLGEELLPVQERAVREGGLFEGKSLLISAPTSSGKTFVGELGALHSAFHQKKVLYLVPLKALAEEKWQDFKRKYEEYGLKIVVSSRDHRDFDDALSQGNFDIAIVVFEKMHPLLVRNPALLSVVKFVVVDELQLIGDKDRGPDLEFLLAKLRYTQPPPQILGLSAVIPNIDEIASWLGAYPLRIWERPVELRQGVLFEGKFHYTTYNTREKGVEEFSVSASDSPAELLLSAMEYLVASGEQVISFLKSKDETRALALRMANRVSLPPAEETLKMLSSFEQTHSRLQLEECLRRGVAFHNADMNVEERLAVEEGFRKGEIQALFATTTLALGVNLPAKSVFIEPLKWEQDPFGRYACVPITKAEFENMGGRAGRLHLADQFGRAILIACDEFAFDRLWHNYITSELEPLSSHLADESIEKHTVMLVGSQMCQRRDEIQEILTATLSYHLKDEQQEELVRHLEDAIDTMVDKGLIREEDALLRLSPLGKVCAQTGIEPSTILHLSSWLEDVNLREFIPLEALFIAATSRDGEQIRINMSLEEYRQMLYQRRLSEYTKANHIPSSSPLHKLLNEAAFLPYNQVRALKLAFLMLDWINTYPLMELEKEYALHSGQIRSACEAMSWILAAGCEVARAMELEDTLICSLEELASMVRYGAGGSMLEIARLMGPYYKRSTILNLHSSGIRSLEDLKSLPPEQAKALGLPESVLEDMDFKPTPAQEGVLLIIDTNNPDFVLYKGMKIPLTNKQFRLLKVLAEKAGKCVSSDEIYAAMWENEIVEESQINYHKSLLIKRLSQHTGENTKDLITAIPGRGLRLNLPPSAVLIK